MCYFFGRDVYKALRGAVPIGLVASDWGGQPIEVFSSAEALADKTCGGTVPPGAAAAAAADADDDNEPRVEQQAMQAAGVEAEAQGNIAETDADVGVDVGVGVGTSQLWNAMILPFARMRFAGAVWSDQPTDRTAKSVVRQLHFRSFDFRSIDQPSGSMDDAAASCSALR